MESDSSAIGSDSSVGKLRELLKLESKSHRDTGRCYDTLQQEYDELLRKYAEAENTIDRLRIDLLRDRFGDKDAANDTTEIAVSNVNAWQRLYDDLLGRTNKLQNNVHAFQEYLVNQEGVGEEMNVIFDRLHTDFGNISNAFNSMQSLGHKVVIPEEKETSIAADDLEGNLYRLGLRLDEIREEFDKKLRNTLNTSGDNLTGQNQIPSFTTGKVANSNKSYEAECSETETFKGELNFDSDTDSELHLDSRRPVTDDLSEMVSYRRQMDDNFGGIESKNLCRSFSEPRSLHNLENSLGGINTPNDFANELNSDEDYAFADFDANDLGSHTVVLKKLDKQNTSAKDLSSLKPSHLGTITSPEDSGYQESSHTLRRGFGSRILKIGSKNDGNLALNLSQMHGPIMEEDVIEEYRKRLDSLRDYILAKRAVANSSSLSVLENIGVRPKNAGRKKKTKSNSTRSSPISKENNCKSSASESELTCLTQNTAEKTRNQRKLVEDANDIAKSNDIETLKNEMHDVRAIILAIKDSLNESSRRSLIDLDVNENEKRPTNILKDEIDPFGEHKVEDLELSHLHSLQNQQFEILKQLESKIDEIPGKMQSILQNQGYKKSSRYRVGTMSPFCPRNRPRGRLSNSQLTNRSPNHIISDNAKGSPPVTPNYKNGSPHKIPDGSEKSPQNSPNHTLGLQHASPSVTCKSPRNSRFTNRSPNDNNQRYRRSNKNRNMSNDRVDGRNDSMKSRDNVFQNGSFSDNTGSFSTKDSMGSTSSQKIEQLENSKSKNTPTKFCQREKKSEHGHRKFDEFGKKMNNLLSYLMKYKESESKVSQEYASSSHVLLKKFEDKLEALAEKVDSYEEKAQNISDGRCLSDRLKEGVGVGTIDPVKQSIYAKCSCTLTNPEKADEASGSSRTKDQFQNHCNYESLDKLPSSPNIYHHYHTVCSPSEDSANRPIMQNSSTEFRATDVNGEILGPSLQSYLDKATLTAVQVEYLSKKMLHTMANDFLYTGPSEF